MEKINWVVPKVPVSLSNLNKQSSLLATWHLSLRLFLQTFILYILYYQIENGNFAIFIPLILLNGFLISFWGWGGAGHEYFHASAFKSSKINRLLFRWFSCATWNNWGWFEVSHLLHHKFTLHLLDPEEPQGTNFKKLDFFWFTLVDLPTFKKRISVLTLNLLQIVPTKNEQLIEFLSLRPKLRKRIQVGAITVFVYQLLIFVFFSLFNLVYALVILFAPFTCTLVNRIMISVQHYSMKYHSNDFRENSRTFRFNKFLEFLYSNMNYHIEHHMYPGVPYFDLPRYHTALVEGKLIDEPNQGLRRAAKISLSVPYFRNGEVNCISCKISCSVKPQVEEF